jgi:uncharacterized membrane protein YhaH (DUF805 family)
MSFGQWLFSFNGRIGRGRFWAFLLVAIVLEVVGFALIAVLDPHFFDQPPSSNGAGLAVYAVVMLLVIYMNFAVMVKRCHDRGKSGWMSLISLIPLVGAIWWLIDLGILAGQDGPNEYGPDPRAA